ncbi:uncharacterized protein Triagg1_9327 [Trichoderma aggressivum f. europaeum]|uniref:Uncharacterized protein n=1 Tax=Trichoderma aggressivum f. europaeum TaxID=173218 RepID=A0AAE1I6S4_9HYPO|nr:hypothetical protein Triagg1_9327 [Trichoderma aggressivum f. europaeum]
MAPGRFGRRFNFAASLCPRMTEPDTLTEHIRIKVGEHVRRGDYSEVAGYTQYEEYNEHDGYTPGEENTQYEQHTHDEEYTQDGVNTRHEEYTRDEEQNENNIRVPTDGPDDGEGGGRGRGREQEAVFKGAYGWYTIGNEDEKDVERGLLTPQAVPMVEKRKVLTCTRAEALEMYQPIEEKFKASYGTADVRMEVRHNFTEQLVRVLPPFEKKMVKMNAEFHGAKDVIRWFRNVDIDDDLKEYSWETTYRVPRLTPKQIDDTWEDLHHLAYHSSVYLMSRMELRTSVLKMLFDEQTKRIQELEEELEWKNSVEFGVVELREDLETLSEKSAKRGKRSLVKDFVKKVFCHRG